MRAFRAKSCYKLTCRLARLLPLVLAVSCAGTSRLHRQHVPEASLRLAEVVALAQRTEIEENKFIYQSVRDAGVPDTDIRDGSVGLGRIFCCGGPNEQDTAIWFYIPKVLDVEISDIVEIWSGREVKQGDQEPAHPNTVTRVVERPTYGHRSCRWVPEDPRLWVRVLYCDGLEAEGWTQQSGLYPVWIKLTGTSKPPEHESKDTP